MLLRSILIFRTGQIRCSIAVPLLYVVFCVIVEMEAKQLRVSLLSVNKIESAVCPKPRSRSPVYRDGPPQPPFDASTQWARYSGIDKPIGALSVFSQQAGSRYFTLKKGALWQARSCMDPSTTRNVWYSFVSDLLTGVADCLKVRPSELVSSCHRWNQF